MARKSDYGTYHTCVFCAYLLFSERHSFMSKTENQTLIFSFAFLLAFAKDTGSLFLLAVIYISIICGSALIIGPVQSFALSQLSLELNPHGVTVTSTGFQIAGCIGSSLFAGVYSMFAKASSGFTAASLLGVMFALAGFLLALYIRRFCPECSCVKRKLKH